MTQVVQQPQQQIPIIVIKGQEVQQLQGIVDNFPTKYGRILDAFFSAVGKRRKEEQDALIAQQSQAKENGELKSKKKITSEPSSETATGINNSEKN